VTKDTKKIIISQDVIFNKQLIPTRSSTIPSNNENDTKDDTSFDVLFLRPLTIPNNQSTIDNSYPYFTKSNEPH